MGILNREAISDALLTLSDLDLEEGQDSDLVTQILDGLSFEQVKVLAVRVDALAALVDDIAYAREVPE